MKGICYKCGLKKDVLFYEQKGRVSLCICHECLDKEEKDKTLSEDIETAIKKFEESSNKKCSKGDGCYICESCKTQLKKRIIYYLKRRIGKLEKLHLFFHNVGMDPTGKLIKKYSISYANCQLRTQNDFLIAEGVCKFAIDHLTGNLSDAEIPDVGKEIKKILENQK